MNLTKRQKMLSAVFVLGLAGLVVDRTLLRPQGGPQAAAAGSSAETPGSTPAERPPRAESAPARAPLAERLNNLLPGRETGPNDVRDPFSLPDTWSETDAGDGARAPDAARGFSRRHQLKAVVMQDGEACAQVDDNPLVPGQWLDGFKLISVNQQSAVFERDGKRVVLDLVVQ
jgi:hypothetical protein